MIYERGGVILIERESMTDDAKRPNEIQPDLPLPKLGDEPGAPPLPDTDTLWKYYHGELPDEQLAEYHVYCMKYRSWQEARDKMARETLQRLKDAGELGADDHDAGMAE